MQTRDVVGARYRLDQRIAVGGMGDVWAARDQLLGRQVALKLLHANLAGDDSFRRRFRAEAKAAARLSHPGIVAVYDYGEDTEAAYLAMELVDGEPLSVVIRRQGRLDPTETMSLVAQTAEALAVAHAAGLVHRDVKPANLLLRPDGRVKVTDFGIVRAHTSTLTGDGIVLGTVAYMSPEQVRGERVTAASDIYSLGVVAYECLSGLRPYGGDESIAVALAHLHDPVPPIPVDVPGGIRQLVLRMLHKEPSARPVSAAAVADTARRLSAVGDATWPLSGLGGTVAGEPLDTAVGPPARPSAEGPPTLPISVVGEDGGRTDAVVLAGLAEPKTMALAVPRPTVPRATRPRRQWFSVVAIVGGALALAVLFAAFSGGAAPPPTVALPQLRGATLATARHRLAALGLDVSTGAGDPSPYDIVLAQQPGAGAQAPRGSTVTLTVEAAVTHLSTPVTTQPPATTTTPTTTAPPAPPPGPPPGHGHGHGHGGQPGNGSSGH